MSDEINGWKPPVIHDESDGSARIATQEDVDRLVRINRELGSMFTATRSAVQAFDTWHKARYPYL